MLAYLTRRLGLSAILLVVVVFATFSLHELLPGDPAAAVLGKQYSPERAFEMREKLGLNDPMPAQFARYVGELAQGDLGRSHVTNKAVVDELRSVVPATVELALSALLIASLVGVALGILTSLRPRSWWDVAGLTVALAGVSLPIFWLAFLAQQTFSEGGLVETWTGLEGLPRFDRYSQNEYKLETWIRDTPAATGFLLWDTLVVARDPQVFRDVLTHLLLPAVVLSSVPMAVIARITRASMGEVLLQDYIRTARAKGLRARAVVLRHALRNAAIPIVTSIGTQLGYLLGGAVLTETIFVWPGLGKYVVDAILNLDVKPLQAAVLLISVGFVAVNLLVDLSYAVLDPRVQHGGANT